MRTRTPTLNANATAALYPVPCTLTLTHQQVGFLPLKSGIGGVVGDGQLNQLRVCARSHEYNVELLLIEQPELIKM